VSDDEAEDDKYVEPTGAFHSSVHDGLPVEVPGTGREARYGRLGKHGHPPLACPDPRYPSSLRGYYRCPGCGEKTPLAGQLRAAAGFREAAERGERAAATIAAGAVQAFWLTFDIARDIIWAARWLASWAARRAGNRQAARRNGGGAAPEMVSALVVMGMVAARQARVDENELSIQQRKPDLPTSRPPVRQALRP
jgi:hypothetical protein